VGIGREALRQIATQPRTVMTVGSGVIMLTYGALPLAAITAGLAAGTAYIVYRCATGAPVPLACPGP